MTRKTPPQPDLQEVLSRARALNPDAVDPSWDAEVLDAANSETAAAKVLELAPPTEPMDPALASFVGSANRHLDAKIRARALQSIPQAPPMRVRRRWHGLAAVAAVLALSIGGYAWISASGSQGEAQRASQAKFVGEESSPRLHSQDARSGGRSAPAMQTSARPSTPILPPGTDTAETTTNSAESVLEPSVDQEHEPEHEDAGASAPPTKTKTKAHAKAKAPRPSLDELDDAAQRAWRAGDLAEAQRLFKRITKQAPRSKRAELAYADLFSLAEQRGDRAQLARLWSAYLERFPSGRYADDTRARLCRRKTKAPKTQCWSEYLRKHPRGAHVQEARTQLSVAQDE